MLMMEQRIDDFFETENIYVMGVSDAKNSFKTKIAGVIVSNREFSNRDEAQKRQQEGRPIG